MDDYEKLISLEQELILERAKIELIDSRDAKKRIKDLEKTIDRLRKKLNR